MSRSDLLCNFAVCRAPEGLDRPQPWDVLVGEGHWGSGVTEEAAVEVQATISDANHDPSTCQAGIVQGWVTSIGPDGAFLAHEDSISIEGHVLGGQVDEGGSRGGASKEQGDVKGLRAIHTLHIEVARTRIGRRQGIVPTPGRAVARDSTRKICLGCGIIGAGLNAKSARPGVGGEGRRNRHHAEGHPEALDSQEQALGVVWRTHIHI